jgi:hypothetical protein
MAHRPFRRTRIAYQCAFWGVPLAMATDNLKLAFYLGLAVGLASPILATLVAITEKLPEVTFIGPDSVRIGSRVLHAGEVKRAWSAWSARTGELVEVDVGDGTITARTDSFARSTAVIGALGVTDDRAARFVYLVGGDAGHYLLGGLLLVVYVFAAHFGYAAAFCVAAAVLFWVTRPRTFVADDRGVRFDGRVLPHRLAYSTLRRVRAKGTVLELFDRRNRRYVVRAAATVDWVPTARLVVRAARVTDVRDEDSRERGAVLARGGRSVAAWREALRALASPGYRTPGVSAEGALEVLCDPRAPKDRRVGAALALRTANDERATARIRVVAEAEQGPLRALLLRVADTPLDEIDDDEIDRACRR